MKKSLSMAAAALALLFMGNMLSAQVPGGLWRFGTTGAYNPQVGNCVSIMAMNSSGQTGTDSGVPCSPTFLTTPYTNATTAYTAVMAMPTVAGSTTVHGECTLIYESSNTAGTVQFAIQASTAPTDLWALSTATGSAYSTPVYTVITSAAQTAVTGAIGVTSATTPYKLAISFVLQNAANAIPNTVTVYAESNNASYTATVLPGSVCKWIP